MNAEELKNRFTYHAPNVTQMQEYESIRKNILHVATLLREYCPESRELSLAITKLEEAVFWANAAIAREKE